MVRTKEEIINKFSEIIGDNNSDEVIEFTEDLSDTFADLDTNYKAKYEESQQKLAENDAEWRKKYRERFSQPVEPEKDPIIEEEKPKRYTFEELFKEG